MNTKKIYIIRHGETEYNKSGIVQGSGVDSALNANGLKQANLFFNAYKHMPFELIYTSLLKRTVQSVQKFIDLGIPHRKLKELNEISWGKSEGVPFNSESNKKYNGIIESWKKGNVSLSLDGGESPEQVQVRQRKALSVILRGKEKLVLISMHGRAMKIMLAWLTGLEIKDMDLFDHDNLSLYVLDYNGKDFIIERSNDLSHLRGFKPQHNEQFS
ncbi:MAG TPA: histidine phosphatase family protein [Cyclobacteriaceae bacterium]|nr:histidine phosphatase family protein [Cyclobacteriaceae bacterium]